MEGIVEPGKILALHSSSVEEIRRSIMESREKIELYDIRLSRLGLSSAPEDKVRFSIHLMHLASLMRGRTVIGLDPDDGSRIEIGREARWDILQAILQKGFAWIEFTPDLSKEERKFLMERSIEKGSKLLMRYEQGKVEKDTVLESLGDCDGVKLVWRMESAEDLRSMIEAISVLRRSASEIPIFLRPYGRYAPYIRAIQHLFKVDKVSLDPQVEPEKIGSPRAPDDISSMFINSVIRRQMGIAPGPGVRDHRSMIDDLSQDFRPAFSFGHPTECSMETALHNRAFAYDGIVSIMVPTDCRSENIRSCLTMLKDLNGIGATITKPLKSLVGRYLVHVEGIAKRLSSINAVKLTERGLEGYNTEYEAMKAMIQKYVSDKNSFIVVLGTGGAGRTMAAASFDLGYKTFIYGSNPERTLKIARMIGPTVGAATSRTVGKLKGKTAALINATPEGMPNSDPSNEPVLGVDVVARTLEPSFGIDLVHSKPWTSFLSSIESRGGVPISGFEIVISQVGLTHQLLTGRTASLEDLRTFAIETYPDMIGG